MGIYLPNMEKPKTGRYFVAVDNTDGKDKIVISVMSEFERGDKTRPLLAVHEAVPVPAHGRLIDADELRALAYQRQKEFGIACCVDALDIALAPTIIPAEPCSNLSKPCKEEGE